MGAAGIVALLHFVHYLDDSSALVAETGEQWRGLGGWSGRMQTNAILADIYDALAAFNTSYIAANSKHKPKKPEQYPRPWTKKKTKRIGRDAIPITEFNNWWKRGKH